MSTVEAPKPVEAPAVGTVEAAPAPVEPVTIDVPVAEAPKTDEVKPEGDAVAPVEEKKEDKTETKPVEPIESGALGYKAPGLKNAFRFSKKYFWFGEAPVASANLREYLRGEKPEVAHSVVAWASQTGKGLLYFVKHADQKEHPAGVLNLAYATDLHKDGTQAFAFKISGHKHTFEAQNAAERDGWYVAVEKAIAEAKEAKDGIESSEAYKEEKEKIGKPTTLAAAAAPKSTDATTKPAESEAAPVVAAPVGEEAVVAAPARAGSSSSSSSDEQKKAKKSKSRSASRKRASIFGGLLGKKDKVEDKVEQKKEEKKEDKVEGESSKAQPEIKEETPAVAPVAEPVTAPVITSDIPEVGSELKTEAAPAAVVPAAVEESKTEETTAKPVEEKPKPTKRGSIFGSFFEKVKSPTHEKKEADIVPAPIAKDAEPTAEASKPLEEAVVAVPATVEPVSEPAVVKADETKPVETKQPAVSTPSKEKEHFSFGKLFGSKDRAKSPAATDKTPVSEPSKVDAVAPKIEDTTAPVVSEPTEPIVAAPVAETKTEAAPVEKKEETTPAAKKEKRSSIFGSLGRSLSKATKGKDSKEAKKETATPTTVPEASEPKEETSIAAPVVAEEKEEAAPVVAPTEQTIGDVAPASINVGEAPKSAPAVSTTA
ncbi:Pleckstrin homology domain-containing protein [Phaeosphaeria sp. MPI-PUGE-AT-0046c]|nr:Pleckstrin homology domain-containing protein [Phaeosphaeria sp. MPI-PUGE-AT-0046c]